MKRCCGTRNRTERGSGSVLMMGLMVAVLTVAMAAVYVGGYLIAGHRVRAAADLAAVSAAATYAAGGDGCRAAERNAEDNDARVVDCDRIGDQIDYVVSVTVAVDVTAVLPGLPTRLTAEAHAGRWARREAAPRRQTSGRRGSIADEHVGERPGHGLVQGPGRGAALGGQDAGRAARLASARHQSSGHRDEPLLGGEAAAFDEAQPARVLLVHEDRRCAGVGMISRGEGAEVAVVAGGEDRQQGDQDVLEGVQTRIDPV